LLLLTEALVKLGALPLPHLREVLLEIPEGSLDMGFHNTGDLQQVPESTGLTAARP
jgi:hypothetical protein